MSAGEVRRWKLREATETDVPFLVELHRATMREYVDAIWGWDDADQARRHAQRVSAPPDNGERWIITVADADIGMLELWWRDDDLYIGAIEISPESQGLGIGSSVLGWVVEEAERRGQPVRLRVLRSNPRACRFYESHAFRRIGEGEHHFEYRSQLPERERP